jgi:hypothetical protein
LLDIARVGIHLITDKGRMLRLSRFYGYSGGYLILDPKQFTHDSEGDANNHG